MQQKANVYPVTPIIVASTVDPLVPQGNPPIQISGMTPGGVPLPMVNPPVI